MSISRKEKEEEKIMERIKLEEKLTYSHNRVSNNLKYLNETIDKMDFDFEFNYLPEWFKLPRIFKHREEKNLQTLIKEDKR